MRLNQNLTTKLLGSVLMIGAAYLCADEHSVDPVLTTSASNVIRSGNDPHVPPFGGQDQPIILLSAKLPIPEDRRVEVVDLASRPRPLVAHQRHGRDEVFLCVSVVPGT